MAGYIGTQAVSVNTTSATITGDASIGGDLSLGDSDKAIFGAGSDLQIYHDGSNSYVDDAGTGRLILRGNDRVMIQKYTGEDMISCLVDGAVKLYHNNAKKFETSASGITVLGNIANASGDMALDTAGDFIIDCAGSITLDSDGGDVQFKDGGVSIGAVINNNSDFVFRSLVSNKDVLIRGNNAGTPITALQLDMSDDGTAIFNNHVTIGGETRTTNINTASSTGTLVMFGGASNKGGTIELSGGNNTGATGSGIVFKTGASTANPAERMRIANSGAVTMPTQPAFLAVPDSDQNNIAVNSDVTVVFSTEKFDQGSDFASNTFTSPVTGKYQLNLTILLLNVDSASNYYYVALNTSNNYISAWIDPDSGQDSAQHSISLSVLADMDASDTVTAQVRQGSGTQQTDIDTNSYFSGYLVA